MKHRIKFHKESGFIILDYKGVIIFDDIKVSMIDLLEQAEFSRNSNIIIDFSNCALNLKYAMVLEYADFIKNSLKKSQFKKVAFLTNLVNDFLIAILHYSLSIRLPIVFNTFSNMEAAFFWIGSFDKKRIAKFDRIDH